MVHLNFWKIGNVSTRLYLSPIHYYNKLYNRNKYFYCVYWFSKLVKNGDYARSNMLKVVTLPELSVFKTFSSCIAMYGTYSLRAKACTINHHSRPKYWPLTFDWLVKSRGTSTCCFMLYALWFCVLFDIGHYLKHSWALNEIQIRTFFKNDKPKRFKKFRN